MRPLGTVLKNCSAWTFHWTIKPVLTNQKASCNHLQDAFFNTEPLIKQIAQFVHE